MQRDVRLALFAAFFWASAAFGVSAPDPIRDIELVSPQVAADRTRMPFSAVIDSCLPSSLLWSDLSSALADSSTSRIWPNQSSQVSGVAQLGAEIRVTYGTGWFAPTYRYQLAAFEPNRGFVYRASSSHPFIGGARVEVVSDPAPGVRSRLSWDGVYDMLTRDRRARRFFAEFAPEFFQSLESNIRALETTACGAP
jgi:hypothetical protein